jgi:hypothetical protein
MADRRADDTSTITDTGNQGSSNIWDLFGDILDVGKAWIASKGQSPVVIQTKTGIDASIIQIGIVCVIALIAWKIFKKR